MGGIGQEMRALLCHCRTHLEAKDDRALAELVKGHLLREHPNLEPTDERAREIVSTRAYDYEFYDPEYGVVVGTEWHGARVVGPEEEILRLGARLGVREGRGTVVERRGRSEGPGEVGKGRLWGMRSV